MAYLVLSGFYSIASYYACQAVNSIAHGVVIGTTPRGTKTTPTEQKEQNHYK
ncbi:hypothetical protein KRN18_00665 (plasmid) [Escherichia coli]